MLLDQDPERRCDHTHQSATNQGGASDADHSGVLPEVPFSAGETRHVITLTATDDTEDDDGESVLMQIGADLPDRVSAGSVDETTVIITDNDPSRSRSKRPRRTAPQTWATSPAWMSPRSPSTGWTERPTRSTTTASSSQSRSG